MLTPTQRAITKVYRDDSGRVLARLIRATGGDFDLAEEVLHEAFEAALLQWPTEGVPESPRAWVIRAARNKAIDRIRRKVRFEAIVTELGPVEEAVDPTESDEAWLADDRLRLVFTCCNPALAPDAQVALTLRTLSGLTTEEIARAFLVEPTTMAQRLVRAKNKIKQAGIPYRVPEPEELGERVDAVMAVIYLVFNEGYTATSGDALVREDVASEAIRLARLLVELLPERTGPRALLALLLLHDARRAARQDEDGNLVTLEEQDRARWDAEQIREGLTTLDRALAMGSSGPYAIQAAIAALHARAARPEETDWKQIAELYRALLARSQSPIVELNCAAAIGMAEGPAAGLARLEELSAREDLSQHHLFFAARADLLRRAGRRDEARAAYEEAVRLVTNDAERRYLARRLLEVSRV